MLVVHHPSDLTYAALPGGRLEWGENVKTCIKREIIEELGVEPQIGRLLFINTFFDGSNTQSMEFFFEILNGKDYADTNRPIGTHAHELAKISWISPETNVNLLPKALGDAFKKGELLADVPRYIN